MERRPIPSSLRLLGAALALCLLPTVAPPAGAAEPGDGPAEVAGPASAEEIRALAERVVADEAYQRQLPGEGGTRPPGLALPPIFGEVFRLLSYVILAVGVIAVLAALGTTIVDAVRGRSRRVDGGGGERGSGSGEATARPAGGGHRRPTREEIERLAAAGAYGEAVHGLLLLALDRLAERSGRRFGPSRTSREILRAGGLDDASRRPLTVLVAAVEQALFATLPLAAADYERCLEAYRALAGEG